MTPSGGLFGGVSTVVSDGLPASTLVAVDATQLAMAQERLEVDVARHASLQTDNSPDSPPSASQQLAEITSNPEIKQRMLDMAAHYQAKADEEDAPISSDAP